MSQHCGRIGIGEECARLQEAKDWKSAGTLASTVSGTPSLLDRLAAVPRRSFADEELSVWNQGLAKG